MPNGEEVGEFTVMSIGRHYELTRQYTTKQVVASPHTANPRRVSKKITAVTKECKLANFEFLATD